MLWLMCSWLADTLDCLRRLSDCFTVSFAHHFFYFLVNFGLSDCFTVFLLIIFFIFWLIFLSCSALLLFEQTLDNRHSVSVSVSNYSIYLQYILLNTRLAVITIITVVCVEYRFITQAILIHLFPLEYSVTAQSRYC